MSRRRKVRRTYVRPKLPFSNYTGFEPGRSHHALRNQHAFRVPIAGHIAASGRKIFNCVTCFNKLPFVVNYGGF